MTTGTTETTIRGLLFDKDGTLIHYDASWLPVNRALAEMAAQGDQALERHLLIACGMDPDSGHVAADSLFAAGTAAEIAAGMVAAGSRVPLDHLTAEFDALFTRSADFSVPVTDLAAFFAGLKGLGLKLGVASSDNEASILRLATRFGFVEHLDFVCGYDSGFGVKPEPGMVLGFCRATGLEPDMVAVVGDNNHDMHMGRAARAGLTVAVLTGTGSRESLSAAADHCLDDITGLPALIGYR
ncbi:HAD family hydrolase [Ensifer soli]|uniref:HAD family hydrolase n=1 Tax=Ciceribacter sp. sgz301302 TaxID=3342379 RepID=UPI0035BAECD9